MKSFSVALLVLVLGGCAAQAPLLTPSSKPLLDNSLAQPCKIPDAPKAKDYDVWQSWVEKDLLGALGDCAIRHQKTVAAWPK